MKDYVKTLKYSGDYGTQEFSLTGKEDMPVKDDIVESFIYADLIASDGSVVTTLKYRVELDTSNSKGGSNNGTTKPAAGNMKYTTDQGKQVSVSAKEYAILTKDYSQVSAKDIIRYYVDIERYGSNALQETESECQMILDKIDAALDEVWKYGGKYITGDPYFSVPYRLALQCEMMMAFVYCSDDWTDMNRSCFMNNDGLRQHLSFNIGYSYGNQSYTGTGKYFLEAFTRDDFYKHKTDCQGGDFATQLLINRAAHRAGLDKSELYVYGVDQGGNHRISIINIEGYFATFGYNEQLSQLESTSHIPGFSKDKVFCYQATLDYGTFYGVRSSGELVRVKDIDKIVNRECVVAALYDKSIFSFI